MGPLLKTIDRVGQMGPLLKATNCVGQMVPLRKATDWVGQMDPLLCRGQMGPLIKAIDCVGQMGPLIKAVDCVQVGQMGPLLKATNCVGQMGRLLKAIDCVRQMGPLLKAGFLVLVQSHCWEMKENPNVLWFFLRKIQHIKVLHGTDFCTHFQVNKYNFVYFVFWFNSNQCVQYTWTKKYRHNMYKYQWFFIHFITDISPSQGLTLSIWFTCPPGTWFWKWTCPAKIFTCTANICTSPVKLLYTAGKISTSPA